MKRTIIWLTLFAAYWSSAAIAQVNSGSDGHDGALNPASDLVIDMADHPDGIYHYTSVNIPAGVTVSFIPNAGNKPVVWLVQGDCVVSGIVELNGSSGSVTGAAGPGGGRGGNPGPQTMSAGFGPGGGSPKGDQSGSQSYGYGGSGSFATLGQTVTWQPFGFPNTPQGTAGPTYGNKFSLPLLGGSGGGGSFVSRGGGSGGALLIATSGKIVVNGSIQAIGEASGGGSGVGSSGSYITVGGAGSGGGIRLVSTRIEGSGSIHTTGGRSGDGGGIPISAGGNGPVRFDVIDSAFGGSVFGEFTQGFQAIILPAPGQGIQLAIQTLASVAVPASPSGVLATPDVIIPALQANPIPIVIKCTNIPLNTEISVVVHPANGPDVQAVGLNNAGTAASSTATISLNLPRGGGIIYAKAVTGIAGTASATSSGDTKTPSLAETGWTAEGERFAKMEITAALGGPQRVTYITESGKRYPAQ